MLRSLLCELRHLSLHHARVDSIATGLDPLLSHLPQQALIPPLQTLRCRSVALGQTGLQDPQAARKRQPIHIQIDRVGRFQHQRSDNEVTQRQCIDFLLHDHRSLAAEVGWLARTTRAQVGFLLVERRLIYQP